MVAAQDQEAAARRRATARCIGLITAKDIIEQKRLPFATRDAQGRLRVGAAIGAKGDYLERAAELIRAGVDVHRHRHRPRPFGGDGARDRGVPRRGSATSS